ncbi:MAG: hypothetical protein KGO92_09950 [Bacteroidota bacterium]|nr:hypothetical protein [Bacteroidota bacterium]
MARKRWTAQEEVTDALVKLRERRKWQLAFRRYVLEGLPSEAYAPYFGMRPEDLRHWFALQFTGDQSWENFGKRWQFGHILPASYFNYSDPEDLKLCWSCINLRVESTDTDHSVQNGGAVIGAKKYFQQLHQETGYSLCEKMLAKIEQLETQYSKPQPELVNHLKTTKEDLEKIAGLSDEEFLRYNQGTTIAELLLEREILRKFGSRQKA